MVLATRMAVKTHSSSYLFRAVCVMHQSNVIAPQPSVCIDSESKATPLVHTCAFISTTLVEMSAAASWHAHGQKTRQPSTSGNKPVSPKNVTLSPLSTELVDRYFSLLLPHLEWPSRHKNRMHLHCTCTPKLLMKPRASKNLPEGVTGHWCWFPKPAWTPHQCQVAELTPQPTYSFMALQCTRYKCNTFVCYSC